MTKTVELRRHTAANGDVLTPEGIAAAVEIGARLWDTYDLLISSGAQRATQTLAYLLAGMGVRHACGVSVDPAFRSEIEPRWFDAAKQSGGGDLTAFKAADPELVELEAKRFGDALRRVFDALPAGGRALVVGHSPMHECAVYGLTGEVIAPISKGGGARIVLDEGRYTVERLD